MMLLLLSLLSLVCGQTYNYTFTVTRLNGGKPLISSQFPLKGMGGSVMKYNYNAAFMPRSSPQGEDALLVRCQNLSGSDIYNVKPSVINYVPLKGSLDGKFDFEPISDANIVIEPEGDESSYGTEDPRAVYRQKDGTYYILYSAVENTTGDIPVSRLALATTKTPAVKSSYQLHGPVLPQVRWSKSGALLIRDGFSGPSYLIWGDSSYVAGIQIATTTDLLNYTYHDGIFIPVREDHFDSLLCEAGPMPLMLSNGNYLFIYNSARHGYPSPKPDWDIQYNVGWVILDGQDPTKILARASEPILSPELAWEKGDAPYLGLTPNVVFVEGWTRHPSKKDTFILFYGAADSTVGAAELTVTIS